MLHYNRTDVSEGIDVNKTSYIRNALFATITIFSKKRFKFLSSICNGWHDIKMMSIDINSIAMLNIDGATYRFMIPSISKSEAVTMFKNSDLSKNSESL